MRARVALALALVGGLAVSSCSGSASGPAATARGTTTTSAGAPASTTSSTLPIAVLPSDEFDVPVFQPARSPDSPYENVPVRQIGTISIPSIGLTHPVYEGVWLTVIDHGPGHWPGTALPGERGNVVFPGHRVTHTHPFLNLDLVKRGDRIEFTMPYGTFVYRVTGTKIVLPSDIQVVDQHTTSELTLIACHPKHSARQRIVVSGVLVESRWTDAARRDAGDLAAAVANAAI